MKWKAPLDEIQWRNSKHESRNTKQIQMTKYQIQNKTGKTKCFTVVCLGDSITCDWYAPSYVNLLQEISDERLGKGKVKLVNAGINGETAQDGYYRLERDVLVHAPDLVTVMFGHNELHTEEKPEVFAKYMRKIVAKLQYAKVRKIWVMTPNQVLGKENQDKYKNYLDLLKLDEDRMEFVLVDVWNEAFKGEKLDEIYTYEFDYEGLSRVDYVHPNEKGQRLIAKYLWERLQNEISN